VVFAPSAVSARFLRLLAERVRTVCEQDTDLETWLQTALTEARVAWPSISLSDDAFLAHLAKIVNALEAPDAFRRLRTSDLYLACACLARSEPATVTFEERYLVKVDRVLARMRVGAAIIEDVKSAVREQLFAGVGGGAPLLADYSGRGDLGSWVRSVAVHAALKASRAENRNVELDEVLGMADVRDSPELLYLKRIYATEFKEALARVLASLGHRERNILRQHYFDGLGIDALGKVYGVHRATAARWIADAREAVLRGVKGDLAARLVLTESQLRSVLGMARSGFDASISALFRPSG
jgi:RNA polymerase sigma-70 factor (ECF subfamily)